MADKTAENGKNSLIQKTENATGCAALGKNMGLERVNREFIRIIHSHKHI